MTAPAQPVRPRVVLVGPMGAGKTTVAGAARRTAGAVPSATPTADIETAERRQISEIFVDDGEACFRDLERRPSPRRSPSTAACSPSAAGP